MVEHACWDVETTGMTESAGGEGLQTEDFGEQANFEQWDFEEIWRMGDARQVLQWE